MLSRMLKFNFSKVIIIFSLIISTSAMAIIIHQAKKSYEERIIASENETNTMIGLLSEYIEVNFFLVDTILKRFRDKHVIASLNLNHSDLNDVVNQVFRRLPYIEAMVVVDKNGDVKSTVGHNEALNKIFAIDQSIKSQEYFNFHIQNMTQNKVNLATIDTDKEKFIMLTRRLNDAEMNFSGVVIGILNHDFLDKFFQVINRNKQNEIALILDNNEVLFHSQDVTRDLDLIMFFDEESAKVRAKINVDEFVHVHDNQVHVIQKFIHDYLHIFAFKHLETLPITLALITYEGDIFSNWISDTKNLISFLVATILISCVILFVALSISKQLEARQSLLKVTLFVNNFKSKYIIQTLNEVNVVINSILAGCDILKFEHFGRLNSEQRDRIEEIDISAGQASKNITNLQIVCKSDFENISLIESCSDIKRLINEAVEEVSKKIHVERVQLVVDDSIGALPGIIVDEFKLRHSFGHLLIKLINATLMNNTILITGYYTGEEIRIIFTNDGLVLGQEEIDSEVSLFENAITMSEIENSTNGLLFAKIFAELQDIKFISKPQSKGSKFIYIIPQNRIQDGKNDNKEILKS